MRGVKRGSARDLQARIELAQANIARLHTEIIARHEAIDTELVLIEQLQTQLRIVEPKPVHKARVTVLGASVRTPRAARP